MKCNNKTYNGNNHERFITRLKIAVFLKSQLILSS